MRVLTVVLTTQASRCCLDSLPRSNKPMRGVLAQALWRFLRWQARCMPSRDTGSASRTASATKLSATHACQAPRQALQTGGIRAAGCCPAAPAAMLHPNKRPALPTANCDSAASSHPHDENLCGQTSDHRLTAAKLLEHISCCNRHRVS